MTSGGHGRGGPLPDPNALHPNRERTGWTRLPDKRTGPAPAWPLTAATARERELWAIEWKRPQAVLWEHNGQALEVALYVRLLASAEMPGAQAARLTVLARFMDDLGITSSGLARNRWTIGRPVDSPRRPASRTTSDASARSRLRALDGGALSGEDA